MNRLARSVAASVDAPNALYPHFAALFKGLPSLGSSPRLVTRLLASHGVTRRSRVLDLACGKAAASLAVAKNIGCRVHAVDGYVPFVDHGRKAAARRGLGRQVTFEVADLEQWGPDRTYDCAMMLGLWPLATAARSLRTCVRAGGLYVIDDVYYDPALGTVPRGLSRPPTLAQANGSIARLGDTVEHVHAFRPSETAAINRRLFARIQQNAAELGGEYPQLRRALGEFLNRQQAANEVLNTSFRPAIWLVRKGGKGRPTRSRL